MVSRERRAAFRFRVWLFVPLSGQRLCMGASGACIAGESFGGKTIFGPGTALRRRNTSRNLCPAGVKGCAGRRRRHESDAPGQTVSTLCGSFGAACRKVSAQPLGREIRLSAKAGCVPCRRRGKAVRRYLISGGERTIPSEILPGDRKRVVTARTGSRRGGDSFSFVKRR